MIDDLAMNAYLRGYIAALRRRHRPGEALQAENPYADDPAQRASWLEGYQDATDEFGGMPTRQAAAGTVDQKNARRAIESLRIPAARDG